MRNFFRNLTNRVFLLFDFLRGRDVVFMYYADNRVNGSTCLNIRNVRDIPFSLRILLTEPIGPVDDPIITDIYVKTYHYGFN